MRTWRQQRTSSLKSSATVDTKLRRGKPGSVLDPFRGYTIHYDRMDRPEEGISNGALSLEFPGSPAHRLHRTLADGSPGAVSEGSQASRGARRQEKSFQTSGYSRCQVIELVQNAADAILKSGRTGKIELVLTDEYLYCANDGQEFEQAGIEAITHAYLSDKRGGEIGRYGLGFKSVLAVTDNPRSSPRWWCSARSFGLRG